MEYNTDNILPIYKALSNETRVQIMEWLKDPKENFDPIKQGDVSMDEVGVCVSQIRDKVDVNQSTVSQYLALLKRVNLLQATRIGKWTYYKRNEEEINKIADYMANNL